MEPDLNVPHRQTDALAFLIYTENPDLYDLGGEHYALGGCWVTDRGWVGVPCHAATYGTAAPVDGTLWRRHMRASSFLPSFFDGC